MKSITAARWVSLVAAFVWGAVAEYHLARLAGADKYTAALLPVVLDVYGYAAFKMLRSRHVMAAMLAMFVTQMVSHLMALGDASPLHVGLSIGVSAIPPAVSLACHRLGEPRPADASALTMETTTAWDGFRQDAVIVDELHDWSTVDTEPVPVPSPVSDRVYVADDSDDTADDSDDTRSKAVIAAEGVRLKAELGTWQAAADAMGITRQWLAHCRKASGVGVA